VTNPDPSDMPKETGEVDDFDDLEELIEFAGDELPGLGTIKRLYRFVKKKLSREYREEIARLRKKEKILIRTIDDLSNSVRPLRNYIQALEARVTELEEQLNKRK